MEFQTVTGLVSVDDVQLADAHAHVWIMPPQGIGAEARFELTDTWRIQAELADFKAAGGTTLIDCQPGGCGRDANKLVEFSRVTGVHITATTGFHLQKYYPADYWLWSASVEEAAAYFIEELTVGMRETESKVCATIIKVGYTGVIEGQSRVLMEAAAVAAHLIGATILFHTERGQNAEALVPFFAARGVGAPQLYMCHVDKRADIGLHRELAREGVLLGYDTFARAKYGPEHTTWPLLRQMVADGLDGSIAIGLDLSDATMWQRYGGQPGMAMIPNIILLRLRAEGMSEEIVYRLTAKNIAERLVRQPQHERNGA